MRLPSSPGTWMTGVPTSMPTGFIPAKWLSRSCSSNSVESAYSASCTGRPASVSTVSYSSAPELLLFVVDPGAQGGVQRPQHLVAELLLGRDRHPHRPPTLGQTLFVSLRDIVATLVEDRQTHDVKPHVNWADLLHLEQPAGGDPGPRAPRVEPHVCDDALFCHGGDTSLQRSSPETLLKESGIRFDPYASGASRASRARGDLSHSPVVRHGRGRLTDGAVDGDGHSERQETTRGRCTQPTPG